MNEVVIYDHTTFIIENPSKSSLTRTYKTVILNKYAKGNNQIELHYDDFRTIKNARVTLYNKLDKKIENYNLKDFDDWSEKSFSLASDNRSKYLDIKTNSFPYIIEVSYTIQYASSYYCPYWFPQSSEKQSVMSADLQLTAPKDQPIRYKCANISPDSIIEDDTHFKYYWSLKNKKGFKYEKLTHYMDFMPVVFTSPSLFTLDGYQGNFETWESFGKWQWELNKDRNTLTPDQFFTLKEAVSTAKNKVDSIRAVYNYVQKNTRYVSIQLGIGGMQPFESGFVHEKKYGDCKALTYYTQCLLQEIGIPSYYTLVGAGKNARMVIPDFPADYFNHIILTVPLDQDTIWLECTSQTNPFGNLGSFTGNRHALLIDENGGHLIKTKNYSINENIQSTSAKIYLESDGKGISQVKRNYQGMEIENNGYQWAMLESEAKQADWFIDRHSWGSIKLIKLQMKEISDNAIPEGGFIAEVEFQNLATTSGDRLFYKPFIFSNSLQLSLPNKERQTPINIRYPYSEIDSVEVVLPDFFYSEKEISDENMQTKFGSYSRRVLKNEDGYVFIRELQINSGKYLPEDYNEFRKFVRSVRKYDNDKLVIINRT
ncbi:MAG: DUF3857 domain-containing protein [Cyclobacteriaceae bacterium]